MMNPQSSVSVHENAVWERLVESHEAFLSASKDFFSERVDHVSCLHHAFHSEDRETAIYLAQYLDESDLKELFGDLVFLASFSHGSIQAVRRLILSLPREWVLAQIENFAEPILASGDYDEYRRLLELYLELDHELAFKLASKASQHEDEDIKEAGEDFLERLRLGSGNPTLPASTGATSP
ncbi:MAG: hypothetical protein ACREBD_01965 [Blastocatellia bacterium]